MNEPEIRQRLFDLADEAPKGDTVPPQLLRRARRRAVLTLASSVAIVLALVAGGISGVRWLRTSESQPAVRPSPALPELRRAGEIIDVRNGNLVAVDPATGATRIVVNREKIPVDPVWGRGFVLSAAWSPDGRWVAYELATGEATSEFWVATSSGEPRRLAFFPDTWAWSPTEAQLATTFTSTDGDPLILTDPSTGRERNLGEIPAGPWTWSPDGTRIVYGAPGGSIYSVDVNSGERSLFATLPGNLDATGSSINWSPDGASIAIVTQGEGASGPLEPSALYVMNADGSGVRLVHDSVKPGPLVWPAVGQSPVAWSPDGTRLAYANFSGPDERKVEIWTLSLNDASPSLLFSHTNSESPAPDAGWPQWSPDGSHIAFETEDSPLVIAADGTGGARTIDELTYRSWRGSWYFCYCVA